MIVDPDFLDHWRTRMVVDALKDELAPVYILRLWAHCQARKSDRHAMPPAGLKAQCRAPHDAMTFEQALADAGFVQRDGDSVVVLGWAEQNAALLAAWENGARGGRPPKPNKNPRVTSGKPTGNPTVTHGEPTANPDETDKSREDKNSTSGEVEKPRKRGANKKPDIVTAIEGVAPELLADYLEVRRAKNAGALTGTALAGIERAATDAGLSTQEAIRVCAEQGWVGFKAHWYANLQPAQRGPPRNGHPTTADRRAETIAGLTNPGETHGRDHRTVDIEARFVG